MSELKKQIREVAELIKSSKKILLSTHINPDGDGIGSGLALMNKLTGMGKRVDFINRDALPVIYRFLPGSGNIKSAKKITGKYDLAIVLECPELERNGGIIDYTQQVKFTVNIDHHLGNTMYGDVNIVDPAAAAVGEQLFGIMKELGWAIDPDTATCIYTSIVTDTGSFRYSNTKPGVHIIAAELLKAGANPERISNEVYAATKEATNLLTLMLLKLKTEGKIGYSYLSKEMFSRTGAQESETDNFINNIRAIRTVEIAMLFKELTKSSVKVSFRSKNGADVNVIARRFKGGGHKHAAGAVINLPLLKSMKVVLKEVRKYYRLQNEK
ncbi:MAG: bifunctional oligoribonuclease/PAP phosphatase NrnA [Candidatus Goldiibacteriota bacterium]